MTIFIFGEAMLEYHCSGARGGLRYGGDTLNTAIHLARIGMDVAYVTALGSDTVSDKIVADWKKEGINTDYVLRHPTRSPGIYAIYVDELGERSFLYWREQSAARDMFALPGIEVALAAAATAEMIYYSLITLAILPPAAREKLFDTAKIIRGYGGKIAYDSNFRPSLWQSIRAAQDVSKLAIENASIGLPTNSDEAEIHQKIMTEQDIANLWHSHGCEELVVKAGEKGCLTSVSGNTSQFVPVHSSHVMDASGAGDAFNAGYLSGRMREHTIAEAIDRGQKVASWVISRRGAVPPIDEDAPYSTLY